MYPSDLKYTRNHEYIRVLEDGTALVGITSYAQSALGDVVFVDLPGVGDRFETGAEFGTVESVKTVSEVFLPSAGEVMEINEDLGAHPERINEDPFGEGWIVRVRLAGPLNPDLLDARGYEGLVQEESH